MKRLFTIIIAAIICSPPVSAAITQYKASSMFDYQYEANTDEPTAESPTDWTLYSSSPTVNSVSGGVLNASFGQDQLWISTTEAEANLDDATGWTYEVRLKVISDSGSRGAVAVAVDDQSTGGGLNGFQIHDTYTVWCMDGATADNSSNTDGFHVFRLAEEAGSGIVHGWRDSVYLGSAASTFNFSATLAKTLLFGSWSSSIVGTIEIDYVRWDSTGAFTPSQVVVTESNGSTPVDEEGTTTDTYTLTLAQQPSQDVDITVAPDNADIDLGAGPGLPVLVQWSKNKWTQIQTVTVQAVDDTLREGPHTATITHTVSSADSFYDGVSVDDVLVTVADNDVDCEVFLPTDLNLDCYVNLADVAVLGSAWLLDYHLNDLELLTLDWLKCTDPSEVACYPYTPPEPKFEIDVFNSTGIVGGTAEDPAHTHRIPALECTSAGTLIAVSDARVNGGGDLPGNIDISVRRSFDNGTTWTPQQIIVDYPGYQGAGDPCILIDRQTVPETIYIFYLYGPEGIGLFASQPGLDGPNTCRVEYVKSTDDGVTWSSPVDINPMVKDPLWRCTLASPGSGMQMRNGTLLVPGYYLKTNGVMYSYFFYSTDNGVTWQYSEAPGELQGSGSSTTECAVVELTDGSLMLNMRNHWGTGHRLVSTTTDMGQTWSTLVSDDELPDPICQGTLIRLSDTRDGYAANRLLFANAASSSRSNGTVRLSYDEGQSWPISKQIYAGSYAYSSLTVLQDGSIGLLYEADGYTRIVFARFSLKWLTDGDDWMH